MRVGTAVELILSFRLYVGPGIDVRTPGLQGCPLSCLAGLSTTVSAAAWSSLISAGAPDLPVPASPVLGLSCYSQVFTRVLGI